MIQETIRKSGSKLIDLARKDPRCSWAPPVLENPEFAYIVNTATGRQTRDSAGNFLSPLKDYIVVMPPYALDIQYGLEINGGRNVVLIGGWINFTSDYSGVSNGARASFIKGNSAQTVSRTIHLEGVRISGTLTEGFNVDSQGEPGLIIQLQNILFTDPVLGTEAGNHADLFQNYNGPTTIRMDRIHGKTTYQGIMCQPRQYGTSPLDTIDLRRMLFEMTDQAGVGLYLATGTGAGEFYPTVKTDQVYIKPPAGKAFDGTVCYPSRAAWGTGVAPAPAGMLSPVTGCPGLNYVSPGYLDYLAA